MTRKNKRAAAAGNGQTQAQLADKYDLYQRSVQEPEHEVAFFDRVYRSLYKRSPSVLREDFCGTFAVCCEWAKKRGRTAIGVDLDPEPLDWGREHNLSKLSEEAQQRVKLVRDDVRLTSRTKAHVLAAQNFSFWIFKTREALREYFAAVRKNLAKDGMFVLDMMGGPECLEEDHEDARVYSKFVYIWEQARFDPITHEGRWYIHFRFKDGSELPRIFRYDWRMWTLPEVRELLAEAGFSQSFVYWEGTDPKTGEGDDNWRRREHAPSDPAWIAYVVAVP